MKFRACAFASLFVLLAACGDDDIELAADPGGADGGAPDARASSSSSGSSSGGSSGGADGGNDAGAQGCVPPAGAVQSWNGAFTLAGLTGNDGVTPKVYDFVVEPDGSVLVAGYFRWAGALRVDGLARWKNGAWERGRADFGALPIPEAGFAAMARGPNGELALAVSLGGATGNDEIWLEDASGWRSIGSYAKRVKRMVWIGTELWIAGGLELANDGPKGLAIWNGTAWRGATGGDPNGYVYDVLADGTDVLVAGGFTEVGGVESPSVARWNGTTWSGDLGLPLVEGTYVSSLARDAGGVLHAGGSFILEGETTQNVSASFAKWTGTEWEVAGGGVTETDGSGVVVDLQLHTDGALYATGCFHVAGGFDGDPGAVSTESVAKWDGTAWTSLDDGEPFVNSPWFDFGRCGFEGPESLWDVKRQRLASSGNTLFLGGSWGGVDGVPSQSVAAFTAPEWAALGPSGQGIGGDVSAFAVDPTTCDLHAVVAASHAGGQPLASRALRWNGTGWDQVGAGLPARVRCYQMVFTASGPLLSCGVPDASELEQPTLFTLEGGAWQPHALGLPTVFDVIRAPDDAVWISGLDADSKNVVGRWNGTAFQPVETAFDDTVLQLATAPKDGGQAGYDLVAGGYFTKVGAVQAARIARWDGAAWHAYGAGFGSPIAAIVHAQGRLYVSTEDDGTPGRMLLGAWNGASWVEVATAANGFPERQPDLSTYLKGLEPVGPDLLVTGEIWATSGQRHVLRFDGTKFTTIGGGVSASNVTAVAATRDGYWFGGTYVAEAGQDGAGAGSARVPSVGVAHRRFTAP